MIVTFTTEEPGGAFDRTASDVAVQLARWGYSVLYVDWNFSAEPSGQRGVADLIADRLDPLDAVAHIALPGGGSVDAIMGGTGRRLPADEAEWARTYADGLADYLEDCAERWRTAYEVVIIRGGALGDPSRGIAIAQLPDAVVVECHGDEAAALHTASVSRDLLPYGRAQLLVLPLKGAVEDFDQWTLTWVHATVRPAQVAEIADGDVRVLAALLANGFAGTDLLVADPAGYVFAAENRDGIVEAARAVRPELARLVNEDSGLDRTLRDLLKMRPTPVARLRGALVSDAEIEAWMEHLLADPEFRPLEAQPTRSADGSPVRHTCPVDGNYVWYRYGTEPVPTCQDHALELEPTPLPRRVDPHSLWTSIAARVRQWTDTGDPGTRPAAELETDVLDLLAATPPAVENWAPVGTAAMSELQRAALLSGEEAAAANENALALFALLRAIEGAVPEPLRAAVDVLDRMTMYRVAGGLLRASVSRRAPSLGSWAAALVMGPGLDAEAIQNRMNTLLALDAETGDHTHVAEAIFLGRTALSALPRPLDTAGTALATTTAFALVRSGNPELLDEAIDLLRPLMSDAHVWPFATAVLMGALDQRSSATGSSIDATEAIELGERALPTADGDLLTLLSATLGSACQTRFELTGRYADIDRSVQYFRRATVDTRSPNHRPRLANLAGCLHTRYRYTRQLTDLREAISGYRLAVEGAPRESRTEIRANLADALLDLYYREHEESELWQAFDVARAVVEQTPPSHPAYPGRLATVAAVHEQLAARTGDAHQREQAIALYTTVTQLSPLSDPRTAERVFPLIQLLLDRHTGQDLAMAHDLAAQLVSSGQKDSPTTARALILLGDSTRAQGEPASAIYRTAAQALGASSETRVRAAARWARAAMDEGDHKNAMLAWSTAIDAVLRLASVGVDIETREHLLAEWANVPREAAAHAIAAGDLTLALEYLEAGRTVLWNQSIDLRTDHSRLAEEHPALARRLTELATILDHPRARARDATMMLAREWDDLVAKARELPGFEGFLRRPQASELIGALGDRTVVVLNAATTRCDALAVSGRGIRVIPLPVEPEEIVAMAASMQGPAHRVLPDVVTKLWHTVARPVLDTLDLPKGSRLWWCPAGLFTMLPIHAASTADDSVLDRVVSSYTSSVTALVRSTELAGTTGSATFVGVQHVPGSALPDLPAVAQEASTFRDSVRRAHVEIVGERATRAAVRTAATEAAVLHLACHAQPSPTNPRNAGLELWDGRLTVHEIADTIGTRQLVYLSACHTAVGAQELPDEVISIAAAFLVAGSRNVVGTLWAVGDEHAATVASAFYATLAASADPATALHAAVTALRQRNPTRPWVWAPYVHLGDGLITVD